MVQKEDIDNEFEVQAKMMKVEIEKLRDYYTDGSKVRENFEFQILENKTVRFLLEHCKVQD